MRFVKIAGVAAASGLAAAGVMHAIWSITPWPMDHYADLARTVVGDTEEFPPTPLVAAVAAALGAAAYLVAAQARLVPSVLPPRLLRAGAWTVAGVLAVRGAVGLISSGRTGASTDFSRMDLVLYSPFCLAIAGLAAYVAISPGKAVSATRTELAHRMHFPLD